MKIKQWHWVLIWTVVAFIIYRISVVVKVSDDGVMQNIDKKCCEAYPHPNFDCRSAWMKGVIMTGNNQPVGYSDETGDHYYADYIEGLGAADRKYYKYDSATNTYLYHYQDGETDSIGAFTLPQTDGSNDVLTVTGDGPAPINHESRTLNIPKYIPDTVPTGISVKGGPVTGGTITHGGKLQISVGYPSWAVPQKDTTPWYKRNYSFTNPQK